MTVGNLEKNIARNMLSYQQNKDEKRPQIRSKGEKARQRWRKGERETPSEAHCGDRNSKWQTRKYYKKL